MPKSLHSCSTNSLIDHLWQVKLHNAARMRLVRMVKPKASRKNLEVPDWVKQEWATGNKGQLAHLLCQCNFDKAPTKKWCSLKYPLMLTVCTFSYLSPLLDMHMFQDAFLNQLEIVVKKKKSIKLIIDEGWYSEKEMSDDLKWNAFLPEFCWAIASMIYYKLKTKTPGSID